MAEKVLALKKTSLACPSQWEGVLEDGRVVYARYRWGELTVGVGDGVDAAVRNGMSDQALHADPVGHELDGYMSFEELKAHLHELLEFPTTLIVENERPPVAAKVRTSITRCLSSRFKMSDIANRAATDHLLSALDEQVAALGERFELVVVGGSALLALGLIERSTRDVDLLALRAGDELGSAKPLPAGLEAARDRVARDFSLPTDWLNPGPTDLLELGLPEGFVDRLEPRDYGEGLTAYFASRYDQIHFKLYALVDQGPGKHEADLRALSPTEEELLAAARWSRTHDPSEGYQQVLRKVLAHMGVRDADLDD